MINMKIENISTSNWENAIRGMRNPYDSWDKSDSSFGICYVKDLDEERRFSERRRIKIRRAS